MTRIVSATEAGAELGQLLDRARERGDSIIIEKDGRPAAALVPMEKYEQIMQSRRRAREAISEFQKHVSPLPDAELDALIDQEIDVVRSGKPGESRSSTHQDG